MNIIEKRLKRLSFGFFWHSMFCFNPISFVKPVFVLILIQNYKLPTNDKHEIRTCKN